MDNCTEHGYFFKGITDAGHADKEDMEDKNTFAREMFKKNTLNPDYG